MKINFATLKAKLKLKKEYWTWFILIALVAIGVVIYVYREPIGKIFPQAENAAIVDLLGDEEDTDTGVKTRDTEIAENTTDTEIDMNFQETNIYTQTAVAGDGITHLARKALNSYLNEHDQNASLLTPEHKIFIEDYMQNATGNYWLTVGQKISFSTNLIEKAIDASLQLTDAQLQNIHSITSLSMVE